MVYKQFDPRRKKLNQGSGTASRAISTTRPSIRQEEMEMAKNAAVDNVLQTRQQAVPNVMPTGNTAPSARPSEQTLVNTGPRATPKQDLGFGQRRESGPGGGMTNRGLDTGLNTNVAAGQTPGMDAGKRIRSATNVPGFDRGRAGIDFPAQASYDEDRPGGPGGPGSGGEEEEVVDQSFREMLESTLMGKLTETAESRAQREAGRAIAAARAQAGRGQMGMSGGMLGLQSDIVTDAVADAEDRLFQQQLGAGRIGTQLEAVDKAEKLGLLNYMQNADFESPEQAAEFMREYLDIDADTASAAAQIGDYGEGQLPELRSEQGSWLANNYSSEISEFDAQDMDKVGSFTDGGAMYDYYRGSDGKYYRVKTGEEGKDYRTESTDGGDEGGDNVFMQMIKDLLNPLD